ncbi:MAG: DUF3868 domain-containing protein [Bacteroidales bacterium]|jgi:outer membrane protein OmpA-like peptidoglycan-associated protein/Trp operon repressor|nr:DUF3868 domain-containing protein [Bacteroidales bacterium]
MKTTFILVLSLVLLFLTNLADARQKDTVIISDAFAEQQGGRFIVKMKMDATDARMHKTEALILTPVIISGQQEQDLPPVIINGKNRYKMFKREEAFGEHENDTIQPYLFLKATDTLDINYMQDIPFETWMQNGRIDLREETYGCAGCVNPKDTSNLLVLRTPDKPDIHFSVTYIVPETEAVKNRNYEGAAYLDFKVGKSDIIENFRNNEYELNKIREEVNRVKNNKDAVIDSITLCGYASPEDTYERNKKLSADRSISLKKYLQKEYKYTDRFFQITAGDEDWDGLKKLVEGSNIQQKDRILDIIDTNIHPDEKEKMLKSLPIYQELLNTYFPKLRRTDYKLNYTVRAFSVEEGKDIIKERPEQMSLNEMYLVANTYPKSSEEFKEVFDIAVRVFPYDYVANNNAAAVKLENNDPQGARLYLDKYPDNPQLWNNQGISYALEEDIEKSREFFLKAQEAGSVEAPGNLETLKILESYLDVRGRTIGYEPDDVD